MKKKISAVISYIDRELKLYVYSVFDDKPFVIYESEAVKVDINKIKSDIERQKIVNRLENFIKEVHDTFDVTIETLNVCFDPEKYTYSKKVYTFDFEQSHRITRGDIKKVYQQAYNTSSLDGYVVSNFSIFSFIINSKREVSNPIGSDVSKLQVIGEIVYVDSKTYYNLISVVENTKIKLGSVIVGNYMIKRNAKLEKNEMLLDIGREKITFTINDGQDIKQTTNDVGYRKFSEELYKQLIETYEPEQAEKGVRFIIEYFVLDTYDIDINVTKDLTINSIVEKYRVILKNYFNYILQELSKQDINIKSCYILLNGYEEFEFLKLLEEGTKIKYQMFAPEIKTFEEPYRYKVRYALNEILASNKILESE